MDEHGIRLTTGQPVIQRPSLPSLPSNDQLRKDRHLADPAGGIVLDADHSGREVGLPGESALNVCAMNHMAKGLLKDEKRTAGVEVQAMVQGHSRRPMGSTQRPEPGDSAGTTDRVHKSDPLSADFGT